MPDRPAVPDPASDQGAARFRADLTVYLESLFLHELADLLGELPEPTGGAHARAVGAWPGLGQTA